jgi:hypothetical protein
MSVPDPLTADLEKKTEVFLSIVEEEHSPIKSSLSDVARLRDAYSELRNIARALDQYARINKGLRYIGLMGTFSSGKSSIINSLVGQDARAADLPPIDDEITILTHPSNRDALMGAHSRGLLKVTTQTIDAELLNNCFLVDTPGSGDPEVREGMVKDFLPICDLILYVFSATSALSIPDLSILRTLQDNLDFVPIRFVISRSDEFRMDHLLPLATDNVDQTRIDFFLANLIGRIRTQAPHLDLSPTNFFFVDNRTKFGIADLKAHIVSELDSDVQLHSKKIAYFRRGVSAQKGIFESYLSTLIEDVAQLENKAKLNKEKYENNVVLSFQSISEFWRPREGAQTIRLAAFTKMRNIWEEIQSRRPVDFGSKWLSLPKVDILIDQKASEVSQDLRRQLVEYGNNELTRRKEELEARLVDLIKGHVKINASSLPPSVRNQLINALFPNVTRSLKSAVDLVRNELLNEMRNVLHDDHVGFETIFEHAKRGDLTGKDNEYYHDFEALIRANLREFLPIVALFKSAVTSAQARNLIARTGLGEKLDVLDNVDIDNIAANDHAEMFLQSVFASRAAKHAALFRTTNALVERKDLVDSAAGNFRLCLAEEGRSEFANPDALEVEAEADRLLSSLLDRALSAVDNEISSAHDVWNKSLEEAYQNFALTVKANRSQFIRDWATRFRGVLGVAAFLGCLAVFGIFVTGLQGHLGWVLTILSGALTTVTVSVLGWGWSKLSTSNATFPKPRWRIATEVAEISTYRLQPATIERSADFEQAVGLVKAEFSSAIREFLARDRERLLSRYVSLAEAERSLVECALKEINAYLEDWDGLASAMSDWYRPDEFKRSLISEAATSIKQRAIEPALKLFSERLNDVRNFSERLQALSI